MSIFDFLQPPQQQTGLAGLAQTLQRQGGQPQGLRQALGAGLLGASQTAQESIPTIMQGIQQDPNVTGGQAFASTFVPSFLGAIGAPAREAQAKEQERRGFQQKLLLEGMRFLSPESQERVFALAGLEGMTAERPEAKASASERAVAQQMAQVLGDPKASPTERESASKILVGLDPGLADELSGLSFGDAETDLQITAQLAGTLGRLFTASSFKKFMDPQGPDHLDWDVLVPQPEDEKGDRAGSWRDARAVSFQLAIDKLMAEQGVTEEEARNTVFKDRPGDRANLDRFLGIVAGPAPPSLPSLRLETSRALFAMDPLKFKAFFGDDLTSEKTIKKIRSMSDVLIGAAGFGEEQPVGSRQPSALIGGPKPLMDKKQQAFLQAMTEMGLVDPDTVRTGAEVRAAYGSLPPEVKAQLQTRARALVQ